jgi:glucose-1-phosphate cytidylyltransferase
MRYYAHHGHTEFVVCLGYKGHEIERYVHESPDVKDWSITCVDTGQNSSIGERFLLAKPFVENEDVFLCNYSDGLTDLHLPNLLHVFAASGKVAALVSVRPSLSYHFLRFGEDGTVTDINEANQVDLRINGGYFVFRREIFQYIEQGDELVGAPFRRLIERSALLGYRYDGFWKNMDTFKDKQALDELFSKGDAPWEVWKRRNGSNGR